MIKSLYAFGKILETEDGFQDYFTVWKNPFLKSRGKESQIYILEFQDDKFVRLDSEPFKKAVSPKNLLFAKPAGTNSVAYLTPSITFVEKTGVNGVVRRLRATNEALPEVLRFYSKNTPEEFEKAAEELARQPFEKGKNYIVTVKINGKWLGEIPEFVTRLESSAFEKYYWKKSQGMSRSEEAACAVTGNIGEVWGFVDTLGFTVDSSPFLRGGFDSADSWKMFPVSKAAVQVLEGAKQAIFDPETALKYNMDSLQFFILPHFVKADEKDRREVVREFVEKSKGGEGEQALKNAILGTERIIGEIVEDEKLQHGIYYDIFFFQKNQSQTAIKLHLSDVLPSQFARIFRVKTQLEKRFQPTNRVFFPGRDGKHNYHQPFQINFNGLLKKDEPPLYGIKEYFSKQIRDPKGKLVRLYHPYFYKVLEAVFCNGRLDRENVLRAFMEKIREAFKDSRKHPNAFPRHVKTTFAFHQFFHHLNLFGAMDNEILTDSPLSLSAEGFVEEHPDFFKDDGKRGAFYLGCLVSVLLEKQNSHLGSRPFMNQLNGLNLDLDRMRKVHLKTMDKLEQYNDKLKKEEHGLIAALGPKIASTLVGKTSLGRTELSYAFATGLVMQKEFSKTFFNQKKSNNP